MFWKTTEKLLEATVKAVHSWAVLPIKRDEKSRSCIIIERSRWRQYCWYLTFAGLALYWTFIFCRYIQLNFIEPSATASMRISSEYFVIAYFTPLLLHAMTFLTLKQFVTFLNSYIKFHWIVKSNVFL